MTSPVLDTPELRRRAPSVTPLTRRATSPVPLRCTGQEQGNASSLLPREAGEVARRATARRDGGGFSPPHNFGEFH
jgi:hypothetical protein